MLPRLRNPFAKAAPAKGKKSGGKGQAAPPTKRALMQLRPVRNPALSWDEQDGIVVLRIEQKDTPNSRSWKAKLAGVFVKLPEERAVELDALGTDVWKMLDGTITMGGVVTALAKKHRLSKREAELSVQQYFKELSRRNYIAFLADDKK